jgi:hypothetical protein
MIDKYNVYNSKHDNVLHVLCKYSKSNDKYKTINKILNGGGVKMLYSKNKDGHTPIAYARNDPKLYNLMTSTIRSNNTMSIMSDNLVGGDDNSFVTKKQNVFVNKQNINNDSTTLDEMILDTTQSSNAYNKFVSKLNVTDSDMNATKKMFNNLLPHKGGQNDSDDFIVGTRNAYKNAQDNDDDDNSTSVHDIASESSISITKHKSSAMNKYSRRLARLINNETTEIYERVVSKIEKLLNIDNETARYYKTTLIKNAKDKDSNLKGLDLANEVEKMATLKILKNIDIDEERKKIMKWREEHPSSEKSSHKSSDKSLEKSPSKKSSNKVQNNDSSDSEPKNKKATKKSQKRNDLSSSSSEFDESE